MMDFTPFQQKIVTLLPEIDLHFWESMAKHTSFRIGGGAEVMAFPKNADELADVLNVCKELNIVPAILGAGTNVLAPDSGLPGLVVCLKDCLDGMEKLDDTHFTVATQVEISDQFFGWVLGFGKKAKILEPPAVVDQFAAYLDKVRQMY